MEVINVPVVVFLELSDHALDVWVLVRNPLGNTPHLVHELDVERGRCLVFQKKISAVRGYNENSFCRVAVHAMCLHRLGQDGVPVVVVMGQVVARDTEPDAHLLKNCRVAVLNVNVDHAVLDQGLSHLPPDVEQSEAFLRIGPAIRRFLFVRHLGVLAVNQFHVRLELMSLGVVDCSRHLVVERGSEKVALQQFLQCHHVHWFVDGDVSDSCF